MSRLLAFLLFAAAFPAMAAYKCVDQRGVKHYEDIPPAACANVVIFEVSPSGGVVRRIEPSSAPAPVEPKKAETDRAALDRQRRDRTLLDTFASEREIDVARDRSIDLIKARRTSAESQLELVRKRHKQMQAGKAPAKDLAAVAKEEAGIERAIAGYSAEMERVQRQFETDKVRWRELKTARGR